MAARRRRTTTAQERLAAVLADQIRAELDRPSTLRRIINTDPVGPPRRITFGSGMYPSRGRMTLEFQGPGFGRNFKALMLLGTASLDEVLHKFIHLSLEYADPGTKTALEWEVIDCSYPDDDSLILECSLTLPRDVKPNGLSIGIAVRGKGNSYWSMRSSISAMDLQMGVNLIYSEPAFYDGLIQCLEEGDLRTPLRQCLLSVLAQRVKHFPKSRMAILLGEDDDL